MNVPWRGARIPIRGDSWRGCLAWPLGHGGCPAELTWLPRAGAQTDWAGHGLRPEATSGQALPGNQSEAGVGPFTCRSDDPPGLVRPADQEMHHGETACVSQISWEGTRCPTQGHPGKHRVDLRVGEPWTVARLWLREQEGVRWGSRLGTGEGTGAAPGRPEPGPGRRGQRDSGLECGSLRAGWEWGTWAGWPVGESSDCAALGGVAR